MKLTEIARLIGAVIKGDPDLEIKGVAALESAGPDEICLYLGGKYKKAVEKTKARALVVAPGTGIEGFTLLEIERPRLAFIEVIRLFHPATGRKGIHPQASISPTAVLGKDVFIGAGASVGDGSVIGDGTEIHENTVIYRETRIGRNCLIYASVTVREGTTIGDRVILHPGVVLGADGFGFEPDEKGVFRKIPQVGRVVVEDDVEIGANSCVDRAALGETRIGRGTKLDNLVQIGHGVKVGSDTVISGNTGVGGSTVIGSHVVLGGGVGVADHVVVGDGVMAAGMTGIVSDVPPGTVVAGFPQQEIRQWRRAMATIRRLGKRGKTQGAEP